MDRIYLLVPPEEYAEAENAGASWDEESKRWYVDEAASHRVPQWLAPDDADRFNLFSSALYVARAELNCHDCGSPMEVICLYCRSATDLELELELGDLTVSNLTDVEASLQRSLDRWPCYRRDDPGGPYANHCPRCGAVTEDYQLHPEPGDVFFDLRLDRAGEVSFTPLEGQAHLLGDFSFEAPSA